MNRPLPILRVLTGLALSFSFATTALATTVAGRYQGMLSGEPVALQLREEGHRVIGVLSDSTYSYEVEASVAGQHLTGRAVQAELGLMVTLDGPIRADGLDLNVSLTLLGETASERVWFARSGSQSAAPREQTQQAPRAASSGQRDPAMVGHWVHEELYNSGSGADFMGSSSTQSMVLLADGRIANGGSAVHMGGSNYSGYSSDAGGEIVAGASWSTRDQHLWVSEDASGQQVDLGRYYVENGRLLLTGNNGKKLLFTRR
ncbi:MAG: hypothetical protein IT475_14930 [Aquimonas sp.]|jgi:hypothetical protein|nr:hypothetical protein [Xanthomonadales bacterium]MCC6506722.1 hypothetical protein [Aquimonas sp.]